MKDRYPNAKDIIYLLGVGVLITTSVLMPGLGLAAGAIIRTKRKNDWKSSQKEWKKFNPYLLKRNFKRLHDQKIVEIVNVNGQEVIKLTQKGQTRYLKYRLEQLSLNGRSWDGKWRIIMYDISKFKRNQQENFRRVLKFINFLQLQKSVYLTPYPCENQITYLREYFGIGDEVVLMRVDKIENEAIYKQYFGL